MKINTLKNNHRSHNVWSDTWQWPQGAPYTLGVEMSTNGGHGLIHPLKGVYNQNILDQEYSVAGCYLFMRHNRPVYAGRSRNIFSRLASHEQIQNSSSVVMWFMMSDMVASFETELILGLSPPQNKMPPDGGPLGLHDGCNGLLDKRLHIRKVNGEFAYFWPGRDNKVGPYWRVHQVQSVSFFIPHKLATDMNRMVWKTHPGIERYAYKKDGNELIWTERATMHTRSKGELLAEWFDSLPPYVFRNDQRTKEITGCSARTLARMDAKGHGPRERYRINGRTAYSRESIVAWMSERIAVLDSPASFEDYRIDW